MDRLAGRIALVTGGARGLGAAIARRFREEGATVLVNDLAPGDGVLVADVANAGAVRAMFAEVERRYGRLDILVNNAGISGVETTPDAITALGAVLAQQVAERAAGQPVTTHVDITMTLPDETWHRVLAVHLDGTFFCTREALRLMAAQDAGCIINMGSIMGTAGGLGAPAYCAAKAGILGFTRALAREVVTRNIRVNAIAPGYIESDMTSGLGAIRPFLEAQTPMGRFGEPDDIAWAAVYLASDEARFVTGQVLSPNGGWHMSQ
ncbi:MAG TPA: 3-oxoacyl-ACP reductase family protein [Candidatus Binatia bacterium]|jgi:3-oxoacyl-[acyl-carrier protein] reductase|nr:3-oxoacyl-ACP reductase family protein [Candidatus Binatia bacterium]